MAAGTEAVRACRRACQGKALLEGALEPPTTRVDDEGASLPSRQCKDLSRQGKPSESGRMCVARCADSYTSFPIDPNR